MTHGFCRICGSALGPPIVECPQCATPHHADCWEYNRGCAIYGCNQAAVPRPHVIAGGAHIRTVIRHPAPTALGTSLLLSTGVVATAALVGLVGVAPGLALGTIGTLAAQRWLKERAAIEETPPESDHGVRLEAKAVNALVGAGLTAQLAQSYALFEQRHPRDSLPAEAQAALALELLDHDYLVIGIEALDKAVRRTNRLERRQLESRRQTELLCDPAYLEEATTGLLGTMSWQEGHTETLTPIFRAAAELVDLTHPLFVLSATARGWGQNFEDFLEMPALSTRRFRSHRMAGPFSGSAAETALATRLDAHYPALLVPAAALSFSDKVEPIHRIHLSQKCARFQIGGAVPAIDATADNGLRRQRDQASDAEETIRWDQIESVFFGYLQSTRPRTELVREDTFSYRGVRTSTWRDIVRTEIDSRPIVEIHLPGSGRRFRIDDPTQTLYDYLGRRREYSHAFNLGLVVKDIVRFGPLVRCSHGIHGLFGEHRGAGMTFSDERQLEEYLLWFQLMGSAEVRSQWAAIGPQVDRTFVSAPQFP